MSTLRYGCFALLAVAAALGGCGLKGPLTLPEKSGQVVVRALQAGNGNYLASPFFD